MDYSEIKFTQDGYRFQHNLESDFACFAVWKAGRPFLDEIRSSLSERFKVLLETEVKWTKKNFHQNAARLYEESLDTKFQESIHAKKIGGTSFIFFVVQDLQPFYTHAVSVSGEIELSNLNVVNCKYELRDLVKQETGEKYAIHSSNNLYEFFYQTVLIIGSTVFEYLMKGQGLQIPDMERDMDGANGWTDYPHLFKVLNRTCPYLVLRNSEEPVDENQIKQISFLTDRPRRLLSASASVGGNVKIADRLVRLVVRVPGDKFFDPVWAKEMLANKVKRNGIYATRADEYFFSLLFSCKVRQKRVRAEDRKDLIKVAERLSYPFFHENELEDDEKIADILRGYFEANGYRYEDTLERGVYKNKTIAGQLPGSERFWDRNKTLKAMRRGVRRVVPEKIILIAKSFLA